MTNNIIKLSAWLGAIFLVGKGEGLKSHKRVATNEAVSTATNEPEFIWNHMTKVAFCLLVSPC